MTLEQWIAWLRQRIAAARGRAPEAFVASLACESRPAFGERIGESADRVPLYRFRLSDLRLLLARAERARDAAAAAREMAA